MLPPIPSTLLKLSSDIRVNGSPTTLLQKKLAVRCRAFEVKFMKAFKLTTAECRMQDRSQEVGI